MTQQEMIQAIARLTAENEALKAPKRGPRKEIKASSGGLVTMTGYRQFPFSFYKAEILDILARAQEIKDFIAGNENSLSQGKTDPNASKFAAAKAASEAAYAARQAAKA